MPVDIRPNHEDVLTVASGLHAGVVLLSEPEGSLHIQKAFETFKPRKTTGHVSVNDDHSNFVLPTEQNEGSFSSRLTRSDGDAIVFFEQNDWNKGCAVFFPKLAWVSSVMTQSYGHEYFVANTTADFLISVNWYVIAGVGDVDLV